MAWNYKRFKETTPFCIHIRFKRIWRCKLIKKQTKRDIHFIKLLLLSVFYNYCIYFSKYMQALFKMIKHKVPVATIFNVQSNNPYINTIAIKHIIMPNSAGFSFLVFALRFGRRHLCVFQCIHSLDGVRRHIRSFIH